MTRDPTFLAECRALVRAVEPHRSLEALRASPQWADLAPRFERLLSTMRRHVPDRVPKPAANTNRITAAHWNIEHGNWYDKVEQALSSHEQLRGADVLLFNEIDLGMARAANRDVAGDLARSLVLHGVWAPMFLETTVGRDDDHITAAGRPNEESLMGVAVFSRWPIGEARIVELPSPEAFQFDHERMIGRHIALIAEIERPGAPFVAVSTHLEMHRQREHRAVQVRAIVEALRDELRPVMLAGDFNTHTFDRGSRFYPVVGGTALMLSPSSALERRFLRPDDGREPLFEVLQRAGFEWDRFVDREPTLQLRLERVDELRAMTGAMQRIVHGALSWAGKRARLKLDWFAGRGWKGGEGFTVAGLSGTGKASDHAPIVARFESPA